MNDKNRKDVEEGDRLIKKAKELLAAQDLAKVDELQLLGDFKIGVCWVIGDKYKDKSAKPQLAKLAQAFVKRMSEVGGGDVDTGNDSNEETGATNVVLYDASGSVIDVGRTTLRNKGFPTQS